MMNAVEYKWWRRFCVRWLNLTGDDVYREVLAPEFRGNKNG